MDVVITEFQGRAKAGRLRSQMKYTSTRGEAEKIGFSDALLTGLASDGGLFVPAEWPNFSSSEIEAMQSLSYQELAFVLLRPFIGGEIADEEFKAIIADAYSTFHHDAVCPLVQTRHNEFVLELFHGSTLAFKDVAMQLLARLMDHVLEERGLRATIVGATSGDTGGAAIDAFAGRDRTDVFILYPHGRVSDVQRRQMTTIADANVHALAVRGSFDDCQALVKDMFNDRGFRETVKLSGVNSINWARIMAQIVYYFYSALALGAQGIHCGTAFVATEDSFAHDLHKQAIVAARSERTVHTDAFVINWPKGSAVRVLANDMTDALGRNLFGHDPDDIPRQQIAQEEGRPVYLWSTDSPLRSMTGELDRLALFAGQVAGAVADIPGAGELIERIIREARVCLDRLACRSGIAPDTAKAEPN